MARKLSWITYGGVVLVALFTAALAQADTWQLQAGAQNGDKGVQALAFLPNEIWIHAGDSITWTFPADEPHTVSFLRPGQTRLAFAVGCPGVTANPSGFDGSTCVNSGVLVDGQTYTVSFPVAGNFKLVCLVHANMTATVHVLSLSTPLPHGQSYYDQQANRERSKLFSDLRATAHTDGSSHTVAAGTGKIIGTPGGSDSASVMRFMNATKVIHVNETVEWISAEAVANHTITFGTEPTNPIPPSPNVTVDVDGARHATISSPSDSVHSGFIGPAPQERVGLPQAPLSATRFRVTFTQPGEYHYICALHDELGMVGVIIVLP